MAGIMQWVGVGFHTDALSPLWKAATTFRLRMTVEGGLMLFGGFAG